MTKTKKKTNCKTTKRQSTVQMPIDLLLSIQHHLFALDKSAGDAIPYIAYAHALLKDGNPEDDETCKRLMNNRQSEFQRTLELSDKLNWILHDEMSKWPECQPGGHLHAAFMEADKKLRKTGKTENDKDGN